MISKFKALLKLFKKGQVVADPQKWKTRQVTSTTIVGVLYALIGVADAFGYKVPVDEETLTGLAVGILAVANIVLTYTTSDKVGL